MKRKPMHPGTLLLNDILPALSIHKTKIAKLLKISRQSLYSILNGNSPITPSMALRIGKLCGNGPELWLNLQQKYDLWHAQKKMASVIKKIPTLKVVQK